MRIEPPAKIGRNLDTCRCGPHYLNLWALNMGMKQWGVWGAGNGNHTVSPVIRMVDGASARIGQNLDTCKHDHTLIKLMGYEHQDDAVWGVGAGNVKHTHTHKQCPT